MPANVRARPIQMALRTRASRNETASLRPRKTPKSSASMASTNTLNATQNQGWIKESSSVTIVWAELRASRRAPALPAFPIAPDVSRTHFVFETTFVRDPLDLFSRNARPDSFQAIREANRDRRSLRHVPLHVREIDFVKSVGARVVVQKVVGFLLICDKGRHTFQHEIKMVGAPLRIGGERGRIPGLQRSYDLVRRVQHVFASTNRKALHSPRAGIEDHCAGIFIHVGSVGMNISPRSKQALLFTGEKDEMNGTFGPHSGNFDGTQGFNHQRRITAVVESTRS